MLQLEINLCFFAFYELVPDWRRITQITHNGPGEGQKQSQSGKCQYPDWGITWSITKLWLWLVRPLIGYLVLHTGRSLVTVDQSKDMALFKQWTIHYARSPLTAHPSFPFPSIFRAFCSDCEQCLFWLQQPPCYFPHLDFISQSLKFKFFRLLPISFLWCLVMSMFCGARPGLATKLYGNFLHQMDI